MTIKRTISTAVAAAFTAAALTAAPGPAVAKSSAGLTSFHGTVSSVSKSSKTFRVKRANGTSLTFRVTSATVFQRISGGFSGLTKGRAIEVKAKKVDGRWSARKVEPDDDRSGGDDNGGGSGRGGDDDGPNHDAGDDHGSGGHGSDD
jgi:Domain of unknown function (DUF5666)